jgi:hypothetical protein
MIMSDVEETMKPAELQGRGALGLSSQYGRTSCHQDAINRTGLLDIIVNQQHQRDGKLACHEAVPIHDACPEQEATLPLVVAEWTKKKKWTLLKNKKNKLMKVRRRARACLTRGGRSASWHWHRIGKADKRRCSSKNTGARRSPTDMH